MITLQLETRGACNARCHFCPYSSSMSWRASGVMPDDLFYKIADEAATVPSIFCIMFHGLNEPLVDQRLEKFIAYAKGKGKKTNIFTNGVLMTPDRFESLKKAGLDSVVVSINAVRPEQHEEIMGLKGKFDLVEENCRYAMTHRDNVDFEVHAVLSYDKFTQHDAYEFVMRWGVKGKGEWGFGRVIVEGNWAEDNRTIYEFKPNVHCFRATSSIYVLYDGTVSACCFDPYAKLNFGNLKEQTLREIYASDKYSQFRQDHVNDEADKWEICANCTRI